VNEANCIVDTKDELDNENCTDHNYTVETNHDYKQMNTIPEQDLNNISNSNGKRKIRLLADKNEQVREQTKIKQMLGQNYTGYHREGKLVFHNTIREKRILKPACTSIYCASSKVRYCSRFKENERQSMFDDFWKVVGMIRKHIASIWCRNT